MEKLFDFYKFTKSINDAIWKAIVAVLTWFGLGSLVDIFLAIRRSFIRLVFVGGLGYGLTYLGDNYAAKLGPIYAPMAYASGNVITAVNVALILLLLIRPKIDTQNAGLEGIKGNTAAALVYLSQALMVCIFAYIMTGIPGLK